MNRSSINHSLTKNVQNVHIQGSRLNFHGCYGSGSDNQVDAPDDGVSKNTETRRAR
jgi:hypothetical protein